MRRHMGGYPRIFIIISQLKHVSDPMKFRNQARFTQRHPKMGAQSPGAESRLQSIDKLIDALSGLGGNCDASGKSPAIDRGQVRIFQEIDLVENNQRLFVESAELFDDTVNRGHL